MLKMKAVLLVASMLAMCASSRAEAPAPSVAHAVEKPCANVQWIVQAEPQEDIPGAVVWFKISARVPAGTTFNWSPFPQYPNFINGVIAHQWDGDSSGRYVWIENGPDAQPFVFYRLRAFADYPDGQGCPVGLIYFQVQD